MSTALTRKKETDYLPLSAYQALRNHFGADYDDPMPAFTAHRQRIKQIAAQCMRNSDTLHERPKVVDSLPGYTSGMAGCRHNLVTRTTCSMRLSVSTDGTIRPLQRPLVGDCSLKRL